MPLPVAAALAFLLLTLVLMAVLVRRVFHAVTSLGRTVTRASEQIAAAGTALEVIAPQREDR